MLGYVALPTFGEVDDNAPAEQAFCDLTCEQSKQKFRTSFFMSSCFPATWTTGPRGAPCESANVTENRIPLAPLRAARGAQVRADVSVLFRLILTNSQNFSTSRCVVSVAKRRIYRLSGAC